MWQLHVKFDTDTIKATLTRKVDCVPKDVQRLLDEFITQLYWDGWPTSAGREKAYIAYYTPGS